MKWSVRCCSAKCCLIYYQPCNNSLAGLESARLMQQWQYLGGLSDAAMDNPISSINVKVSLTMLPMVLPGLSMDHPFMATLTTHSDHLWTIHGSTPCLTPSVYVSVDATVTVPSMDHPWMTTLAPLPSLSIRGCHSYTVPSMDHPGMATLPAPPSLSKFPWMSELLCHPWTIHGWPPCLPFPLYLSIRGCQSYFAIHGPSRDGHLACPSLSI